MKTIRGILLFVSASILIMFVSTAGAVTLSLGTWGATTHPQVKAFVQPFMQEAEKKSHGDIKFKYFPSGQIVKQNFVPSAVPTGQVDIALTTLASWAGRIPDTDVTAGPLWTLSLQETTEKLVPGNPIFDFFDKEFQKQGTKILCIFDLGPAVISSKFPLKVPEDLHGKKLRVSDKGQAKLLQQLGVAPVVMSVGALYSALQYGTVDGAVQGLQGMIGLHDYEVVKHLLVTNGIVGSYIHGYVMNLQKFRQLSKANQKVLMQAAADARNRAQDALTQSYQKYVNVAQKKGMKLYRLKKGSPEWKKWKAAEKSFVEQQRTEYSPAILKLLPKE